ncbi:MAG TPA: 3-dehydroquinate synthase [Clostridiales bacterium]|nr:3-dehydroquinate synthase [Clostridiales bacterium]
MKTLDVTSAGGTYPDYVGRGILKDPEALAKYLPFGKRKVLVVTDDGVPSDYTRAVLSVCPEGEIVTLPAGEGTKSLSSFELLLSRMLDAGFTRSSAVCAVGGGVVGDLSGFAAACYMRGIDFYNLPTTMLSMVDSSVGGKTAIDFHGTKNTVGAFYPPRAVLIDCDVLKTLPARQMSAGLAEAVKMALTSGATFFSLFENETLPAWEEIVLRSVAIKAKIVGEDEKEAGLRKLLNFGHTLGHAIEAAEGLSGLLHGECVALGMLPMCSPAVRKRLLPILDRLGLPTAFPKDTDRMFSYLTYDKKRAGDKISAVFVDEVGKGYLRDTTIDALCERVTEYLASTEGETK